MSPAGVAAIMAVASDPAERGTVALTLVIIRDLQYHAAQEGFGMSGSESALLLGLIRELKYHAAAQEFRV